MRRGSIYLGEWDEHISNTDYYLSGLQSSIQNVCKKLVRSLTLTIKVSWTKLRQLSRFKITSSQSTHYFGFANPSIKEIYSHMLELTK